MSVSQEFAILGAGSEVYELDAIDGFADADETGVTCRARTKRFAIYGPAGEAVLRRIFISVEHEEGCRFFATPVVNGRVRPSFERPFARAPAGRIERVSFLLPVALRGTTFGCEFRVVLPERPFHIETVVFETIPLSTARSRAVGE